MMNNINIKINKETRQVDLSKSVIGNDGENLQEKLVFSFNNFVNGTARLELLKHGATASYVMLTKVGETYELPIKSVITKSGKLNMQLVITEGTDDEEIPIFKSNVFYVIVNSSINAEIEEEEEYPQWIDVANTKLNEIDEALDDLQDKVDSGYFKGDTGAAGQNGRDATINGVNTLTLTAGDNITLNQSGSTLEISATGGGTSNYADLSNKPKINNVELSGNKTTSDLGINIPDVSNFITKDVNDLTYYTKSSDLSNVATSGDYNDLINKPSITSDGINVYYVVQNSSNPFVFDGKKKGLYIFLGFNSKFYYKLYENENRRLYNNTYVYQIYLDNDFTYISGQTSYSNIGAMSYFDMSSSKSEWRTTTQLSFNNGTIQGNSSLVGSLLSTYYQTISGEKVFNVIPKQSNTNAPTNDVEFTNKKYVDDSISTALGTIETTLGGI